jgi:hypothetical protein
MSKHNYSNFESIEGDPKNQYCTFCNLRVQKKARQQHNDTDKHKNNVNHFYIRDKNKQSTIFKCGECNYNTHIIERLACHLLKSAHRPCEAYLKGHKKHYLSCYLFNKKDIEYTEYINYIAQPEYNKVNLITKCTNSITQPEYKKVNLIIDF